MRVMVLLKSDENTEAGLPPSTEILDAMGKYNEELVKAGIMLAGEGLKASSQGKRVRFLNKSTTVLDGPFAETKELVSGFWIWQVASMDEAIEWITRAPFSNADSEVQVELRPVYEFEDFGEAFTPELQEREQKLRDQVAAQQK